MREITLTLTDKELERLATVMAYNIDMNIQAQLNKAMERKQEAESTRLMQVKASDQALVAKLWKYY